MTILEVKKVDFWTFSKLFWTCLGSVWASFLASKGLFWVYFIIFVTHNCSSPLGSRGSPTQHRLGVQCGFLLMSSSRPASKVKSYFDRKCISNIRMALSNCEEVGGCGAPFQNLNTTKTVLYRKKGPNRLVESTSRSQVGSLSMVCRVFA